MRAWGLPERKALRIVKMSASGSWRSRSVIGAMDLSTAARLCTGADLYFWYYRDKNQAEVDIFITQEPKTWDVEVKGIVRGNSVECREYAV